MISSKNVKQLDMNDQDYVFALRLQKNEKQLIDRQNLKPKDIIEKAFRTIKSEIGIRPFFLSSEESVAGYIFICALAYQVRSILRFVLKRYDSEMSIEEAFEVLDRLKVVKISVEEEGVQVYRKVSVGGQRAIDVIHCFDVDTEFEKVSGLNSV